MLLNRRPRNPPSSTVRVTSAHGTFRGPFVWQRLLSDCCGRCVGVFLAGDEDRFTNPTKAPRADGTFRGPFVWRRLLSDCCGRCVWVFWRVTRTASRTLRKADRLARLPKNATNAPWNRTYQGFSMIRLVGKNEDSGPCEIYLFS